MDFSNEKYEYCLNTWGGFYNHEHKVKHGKEEGFVFFDTMGELKTHLAELREIEERLNARVLMASITEGTHVRYKTIAKMTLKHQDTEYPIEIDFGYGYPVESALYMFEEGNYSCDCNKSLFIRQQHNNAIPEETCGEDIQTFNFEILQIKK